MALGRARLNLGANPLTLIRAFLRSSYKNRISTVHQHLQIKLREGTLTTHIKAFWNSFARSTDILHKNYLPQTSPQQQPLASSHIKPYYFITSLPKLQYVGEFILVEI